MLSGNAPYESSLALNFEGECGLTYCCTDSLALNYNPEATSNDNSCTLRKDIKETKGSLKEEHILKTLSKILSNSEQAYKITQQIIEELPSKEVISK